jgi:hypothetical protein
MSNLTIKKKKRMKYAILHCFFMEKRRKRRDVHCKTKKMKGEPLLWSCPWRALCFLGIRGIELWLSSLPLMRTIGGGI